MQEQGYAYFYVAEVATAIYVANLPLCWPLIQRLFRALPWPSHHGSGGSSGGGSRATRLAKKMESRKGGGGGGAWATTSRANPTPWAREQLSDDDGEIILDKLGGSPSASSDFDDQIDRHNHAGRRDRERRQQRGGKTVAWQQHGQHHRQDGPHLDHVQKCRLIW